MRFPSLLAALILMLLPASGPAQQSRNRLALGIGVGRFVPLQPLATADGRTLEYKLDDAGATVASLDFWLTRSLATRLSYQWLTTDLAEPDQPSFARIRSGYAGLVLAPVQVGPSARPYAVLGGGFRYYDVNTLVVDSAVVGPAGAWDIAPKQTRVTGYGGLGSNLRIGRVELVPEAGVFFNPFRHHYPCNGCSDQRDTQLDLLLSIRLQLR
jgi:hypothetical protein